MTDSRRGASRRVSSSEGRSYPSRDTRNTATQRDQGRTRNRDDEDHRQDIREHLVPGRTLAPEGAIVAPRTGRLLSRPRRRQRDLVRRCA